VISQGNHAMQRVLPTPRGSPIVIYTFPVICIQRRGQTDGQTDRRLTVATPRSA